MAEIPELAGLNRAQKLAWLADGATRLPGYYNVPGDSYYTFPVNLFGTEFTLVVPQYDGTGRSLGMKVKDFVRRVFGIHLTDQDRALNLFYVSGRFHVSDDPVATRLPLAVDGWHWKHRYVSLRDAVRLYRRRRPVLACPGCGMASTVLPLRVTCGHWRRTGRTMYAYTRRQDSIWSARPLLVTVGGHPRDLDAAAWNWYMSGQPEARRTLAVCSVACHEAYERDRLRRERLEALGRYREGKERQWIKNGRQILKQARKYLAENRGVLKSPSAESKPGAISPI